MAQEIKGFADHFDGFKRHLKLAGALFAAILAAGIVFAYTLPDIYQSQGYILIEEPQIPSEILRSTITGVVAQQLASLNEKILTIPNIIRLIEEFDLYAQERLDTPVELLVEKARASIAVEIQSRASVSASGLPAQRVVGFTVAFEDEDPEATKLVADELVQLYLEENLKSRSAQTRDTAAFLAEEVNKLETEIGDLEANLAKFKEDNADRLPSLNSMNMSQMQRIDDQLLSLEAELQAIQQTRIGVESQLVGIDPSNPVRLPDGTYALSPVDQLKQLQTQLIIYQSRYSDDHPDVKATRRDI
jgi:succinoglycan biosynthesis transport protein ExoP